MSQLILVRHGQSQWNLENRFTGWVDVPLTEQGRAEARQAGQLLRKQGLQFSVAFTSYLQRAIETLWTILAETDQRWLLVDKSWRLNERHYGALQGLNKQETRDKYGDDKVFEWRRSFATRPPEASAEQISVQRQDRRYTELSAQEFPRGESLQDTVERVRPYFTSRIRPRLEKGETVLVSAHGNSLRALVMMLAQMSETEITQFEFETGAPLRLDLSPQLKLDQLVWIKG